VAKCKNATYINGYCSGILACIAKNPTLDRLGSTRKNQYIDTVYTHVWAYQNGQRHFW